MSRSHWTNPTPAVCFIVPALYNYSSYTRMPRTGTHMNVSIGFLALHISFALLSNVNMSLRTHTHSVMPTVAFVWLIQQTHIHAADAVCYTRSTRFHTFSSPAFMLFIRTNTCAPVKMAPKTYRPQWCETHTDTCMCAKKENEHNNTHDNQTHGSHTTEYTATFHQWLRN